MRFCSARFGIGAISVLMLSLGACSQSKTASPAGGAGMSRVADVVIGTEPWTNFPGATGTLTRTASYRIYTTANDRLLNERLPVLAEAALGRYRSALADLPGPGIKLDTYLMANRQQWARLTTIVMRERAEPYLRIARGGFAAEGRGLFWDIGPSDTLSLAAHEGWHQYTQRAFKTRLPPWLEEGIASYHEGFRWSLRESSPTFLPWSNPGRFDQLREAQSRGRLKPLSEIARLTPGELIGRDETGALDWYAQVWAAVLFLQEGEGGRYASALDKMLRDAADGTLWRKVSRRDPAAARAALRARGGGVLLANYTGVSIDQIDREYAAFVARAVAPGARGLAIEGRSPVLER